ncbi:DUF1093 domain-containing protein [Apilactobacillus xinyiensis]|uniref:DUF1093 domain-containing protein n=1 Tax=Apilactobacillus xinyiensis TaxID=2841032 RepID=UPI003364BAD7
MKKIFLVILAFLIVLLGFFIFKNGNEYYQNRYNGEVAYAKVPDKIPSKEQAKDSNNKIVKGVYTYKYHFKFVNEKGQVISMEHYLSGEHVKPLKPGSIVKAEVSNQLIVKGPNTVNISDVPKRIINKLN